MMERPTSAETHHRKRPVGRSSHHGACPALGMANTGAEELANRQSLATYRQIHHSNDNIGYPLDPAFDCVGPRTRSVSGPDDDGLCTSRPEAWPLGCVSF